MKLSTMVSFLGQYLRKARIREISPQEVMQDLGKSKFVLLDANLRGQWLRGHIPGAKYVGMEEVEAALPEDRSAMLVFYCESTL